MFAWRKVAALSFGVGLTACAAIWGFEDGILDDGRTDAAPTADVVTPIDAPTAEDAGDAEAPEDLFLVAESAPPGCADRTVDASAAVFAHVGVGVDSATCGTQDEPCKSFTAALTRAIEKGSSVKYVYLASGTYTGSVSIANTVPTGLVVEGAWRTRTGDAGTGLEWIRDCRADTPSRTVIKGDQNKVIVAGTGGDAGAPTFTLSYLSVNSKQLAGNGESLYGVFLNQAVVKFQDVWLRVEEGGPGNPGTPGAAGTAGAAGGCAPAPAGTAGAAGAGSTPVTFGPNGIGGGDGIPGGAGGAGATGTAGGLGGCTTCKDTCNGIDTCAGYPVSGKLCGSDGLGGCGGGGGKPGGGGLAGGSSVAVYAVGGKVDFLRTKSTAGPGGNGGIGSKGGTGGTGAAGAAGTDTAATCFTDCNVLVCATPKKGTGGTAGGMGAVGAAGGIGGGGAGGHALCVVGLAGAQVTNIGELACTAKAGGAGGPAPDGGVPGATGKSGAFSDGGL